MKSSGGEHFLGLDQVRALAAFMVFSWHFSHFVNGYPVPFGAAPLVFPLAILDEGHTGVSLFMTLSGYLFAKLLDDKNVHFPSFLWNRFLRLAPLMIVVLVGDGITDVRRGVPLWVEIKTFAEGAILPNLPNSLWSITVECHFYFLLPLLLWLFRRFAFAAIAVLTITIGVRTILYFWIGEIQDLAYWTIVGRIDQFVLGIAAFRYSGMLKGRHRIAALVALGFSALYWLFDYSGGFYHIQGSPSRSWIWIVLPTVEGAAYALLIAYYDRTFSPRNVGLSRLIGLAGTYSYSIYILHTFFVFEAAEFINAHIMNISNFYVAQAFALLCFTMMIPLGYLSFQFVESPFLQYRKRYIRASLADPLVAANP